MKPVHFGLLALCVLLSSCAGRLAMVGFDKNGKVTEAFVSESKYADHLHEALVRVDESVTPQLAQTASTRGDWKLRTAVIGFGVKAEAGIGPFKVALKPKIRAAFSNGNKPPIP